MNKKILFVSLVMLLFFPMISKAQSVINFPYFNEGTNSYIHPFVIILSIPLAVIGVFP